MESGLGVNLTKIISRRILLVLAAWLLHLGNLAAETPSLRETVEGILQSSHLDQAKTSIQIVRLSDRKILYERDPDRLLNPASNVKIFTAAAALRYLGPDFTFRTEFLARSPVRGGVVNGLWIKGYGDPIFVTEELEHVVSHLKAQGLSQIQGHINLDDSWFDQNHTMTYVSDLRGKRYSIVTGALSFNFNKLLADGVRGHRRKRIPPQGSYDPALFAGMALLEAFQKGGIVVRGGVKREAAPAEALPIWIHTSPPLREVLKGLGKFSNNFIAEQLVKALGAIYFGPPGTTEKGLRAMRDYLTSLEIPETTYQLENGSGLAKGNLFSANQILKVLTEVLSPPWDKPFRESLSVAGIDGTLASDWREPTLKGRVVAKTGSLAGVQALSGYVIEDGNPLAFSFLFNDFPVAPSRVRRAEERILAAVAKDRP